MHLVVLKILWPYVMRHLAGRAADYVNQRRERRLQLAEELAKQGERPIALANCPPCPPCPPYSPSPGEGAPATGIESSPTNKIWFTASGLLLGSAFAFMVYMLLKNSD